MHLFGAVSADQAKDLANFHFTRGSRLHLLLPMAFFALAVTVIFGWEYYKDWRMKRIMKRFASGKAKRARK